MGLDIAMDVMGDIFYYLDPNKLDRIARYSCHARHIINNYMNRGSYIDSWHVSKFYMYGLSLSMGDAEDDLDGDLDDKLDNEIEYALTNYWYYILSCDNDTYPRLLTILDRIKSKILYLDIASTHITDVELGDSSLVNVYALSLTGCKNITDVSALYNVHTLNISWCYKLTNMGINNAKLGNVHTLRLQYLDISSIECSGMLANIKYLYVHDCDKIKDVNKLGSVYSLYFRCCYGITDVGSLGNVHTLDLEHRNDMKNIYALGRVHTLNLRGTNITEQEIQTLYDVHTLSLITRGCITNASVAVLGNVYELYICLMADLGQYREDFSDIGRLGAVNILHIVDCNYIKDVSMLGGVNYLYIEDCQRISDVGALGNINKLTIENCYDITDVSGLANVNTLLLYNCANIKDVSKLGNIYKLSLYGCIGVTDVSKLGNVHYLDLTSCHGIRDVSELGNVHTLDLRDCKNISYLGICCIPNVNILNLSNYERPNINAEDTDTDLAIIERFRKLHKIVDPKVSHIGKYATIVVNNIMRTKEYLQQWLG